MTTFANDLSGLTFKQMGSGCYRVTYTTPKKGDYYVADITDMTIIDATLHARYATWFDIEHLKRIVRRNGIHYSPEGIRYDVLNQQQKSTSTTK